MESRLEEEDFFGIGGGLGWKIRGFWIRSLGSCSGEVVLGRKRYRRRSLKRRRYWRFYLELSWVEKR